MYYKEVEDERIVQKYDQIKTQLYIDLQEEFKEDLKVWRATIDSTLCIRFQEPAMLFDNNKAVLKPLFKEILDDFFPRYIKVLNRPEYKENIVEIRIEGHNDELLLDFNLKEALEEDSLDLNFCSVGEDANELFKKDDTGRWVRKTDKKELILICLYRLRRFNIDLSIYRKKSIDLFI